MYPFIQAQSSPPLSLYLHLCVLLLPYTFRSSQRVPPTTKGKFYWSTVSQRVAHACPARVPIEIAVHSAGPIRTGFDLVAFDLEEYNGVRGETNTGTVRCKLVCQRHTNLMTGNVSKHGKQVT